MTRTYEYRKDGKRMIHSEKRIALLIQDGRLKKILEELSELRDTPMTDACADRAFREFCEQYDLSIGCFAKLCMMAHKKGGK